MTAAPSFAETARAVREAVPVDTLAASLGIRLVRGRGPCPICGTSRTSQAFSVRSGRWRCFACGAHGDAVDLVQAIRGCSAREALAELASQTGLDPNRPIPHGLRRRVAEEERRRVAAKELRTRLNSLSTEAGRWERLAEIDAETAQIAWRMGLSEAALSIATDANHAREEADRLDREADRLAEERKQC